MIIIRCSVFANNSLLADLHSDLVEMAKTGVLLLPSFCELLNEVPPNTEVIVVKKKGE